ncbi:MAG: hypothetical protein WBO57_02375, partial [Gammaproteobacteria bacterium]
PMPPEADPAVDKNKIISHQKIYENDETLNIIVNYFYSGDHGEDVWMSATATANGQSTGYWTYRPARLIKGEHQSSITVGIKEDAPSFHCSDGIVFNMFSKESGMFYTHSVKFNKCWRSAR